MTKYGIATFISFILLTSSSFAQTLNNMVNDSAVEQKVLIGYCDRAGLEAGEFGTYFLPEYEAYSVSDSLVKLISKKINEYQITIVFGSWCSDSQEQLPRFYKILDKAGYNDDRLTLIAVNREKLTKVVDINALSIERVPTFIVYKKGKEIGRIVETPENTLEEDLWKIVR
jgi:thiol-disulfide isomerase/thioredoxin